MAKKIKVKTSVQLIRTYENIRFSLSHSSPFILCYCLSSKMLKSCWSTKTSQYL